MRVKNVYIDECKIGDVLAKDIYNHNGILVVTEKTQLNEYIIRKLKSLDIIELCVYENDPDQNKTAYQHKYQEVAEKYDENISAIKEVITDLAVGKPLDYTKIEQASENLYEEIDEKTHIIRCLSTVKNFDQYTFHHSVNVALYSMLIAKWLYLPEEKIRDAIKTGLLHDMGKSLIPIEILNKNARLTDEEYLTMKKHPMYGYNMAKDLAHVSDEILDGILMHHEREDGTGYPFGIGGDEITLYAKIIALADVYDALTSERVYKKRITPFETFSIIEKTGLRHFDIKIMMTFLHNIASYYIGSEVIMDNGKHGTVVYVTPHNISLPIIKVDDKYIDMSKEKNIKIIELIG